MPDLKSSLRAGVRPRTHVSEDRADDFIRNVARHGGALPPGDPPTQASKAAVGAESADEPKEKTREIHVRIPMSLHKQLAYAAIDRNLSMTQLAAAALAVGLEHLDPLEE